MAAPTCKVTIVSGGAGFGHEDRDCGTEAALLVNGFPMCAEHETEYAAEGLIESRERLPEQAEVFRLPRGYWHALKAAAAAASGGPWARSKQVDAIVSGDPKRLDMVDEEHRGVYGGFVVAESMQETDRRYVLLIDPTYGLAIAELMLRAEGSPLTLEQARVVRSWAVDLECSNARVAELFDVTWGGGTDIGRGDEICAAARSILGESW